MTPEDYFEKLPDRLKENINELKDDLRNNVPLLYKYGRRNPYTVPEDYFLNQRERLGKRTEIKTIGMRQRITIAASFIILLGAGLFIINRDNKVAEIAETDVLDYYMENIAEVDDDFLLVLQEEYGMDLDEVDDTEAEIYYEELMQGLNDYELDNLF